MRYEQNAVLTSLRRAQQFLDAHNDVLAAVNGSTRKQLDAVVTQLSDLAVAQNSGARGSVGETARQRALRAALRRNYMAPIADIAKLNLRDVPEFAALTLPPAVTTPDRAVTAAYAMADAAAAHASTLVDNGLPATFADDLRTAAAAVTDSLSGRTKYQGRRTGATAGLAAGEKRGRTLLRVLNALITVHIGTDAQLVGEWTAAKLVRRKPGPATGSQTTQSSAVTPIHSATPAPTPAPVLTPTTTPVTPPTASPVAVAA